MTKRPISPSRFHAVFRGALGVGLSVSVQSWRTDRAQDLLIGTVLSTFEINVMCGDENPFLNGFRLRICGKVSNLWRSVACGRQAEQGFSREVNIG